MPLRLITGPANSAKAGAVLDAYRTALRRDPVLVVPTFADVEHYGRELAAGGAVFGGTVVRFEWLLEAIARAAAAANAPSTSPALAELAGPRTSVSGIPPWCRVWKT